MSTEHVGQLKVLCQKLATDVVFARPQDKAALLAVRDTLGQMEQLCRRAWADSPVAEAVTTARCWLDELAGADLNVTREALARLNAWATWTQQAAAALEEGRPLPALPAEWQGGATLAPGATDCPAAQPPSDPAQMSEPVLEINAAADAELLREFLNESVEHLQNIEQGVLALEQNPSDRDALQSLFRAFHTFKGSAGFLNLAPVQRLAHQLESLLDAARAGRLRVTPPVADVILAGSDTLKQFLAEIDGQISGRKQPGPIRVPTLGLLARIREALAGAATSAPTTAAARAAAPRQSPGPAASAETSPDAAPRAEGPTPLPSPQIASKPAPPGDDSPKPGVEAKAGAGAQVTAAAIKVDTAKLDNLMDLVGELVIAESLVAQNPALRELADRQLNHDLAQLSRITRELQHTVMALRMVPIRSTFQKMHRLVRDLCAKTGKQVDLVTEGEDTEVDRNLVEELSDPLVHMLRNALDHGVEPPEERRQHGKPLRGQVTLRAYHQGGNIVLEVADDGRGLDPQKLRKKAVEKGLVSAEAKLSDGEVLELIFAPGFSTAEQVTDLSGRGVGMDVVRRNIERLRGKVEVRSAPGRGTTFVLYLPLTLAIIEGLIVSVGEQRCILPALAVSETFRPSADMVHTVQGRGEAIRVRDRLCPVLRLRDHLEGRRTLADPSRSTALVLQAGASQRCVLVDQVLGKQEVVIKNLGGAFPHSPLVAGAAILGDGCVGLILDPNALVHLGDEARTRAA